MRKKAVAAVEKSVNDALDNAYSAIVDTHEMDLALIPVDSVIVSDDNPRNRFDSSSLNTLADSIKKLGLLHPITVRQIYGGYQLISGERRLRAFKLLGREEIHACIKECDDGLAAYVRFIENEHREDLNPIERAVGLKKLLGKKITFPPESACDSPKTVVMNSKLIAQCLKMTQASVSQYLALLDLPSNIQNSIECKDISFAQARAIGRTRVVEAQQRIYQQIIKGDLKRVSDIEDSVDKADLRKRDTATKRRGKKKKESMDVSVSVEYADEEPKEKSRGGRPKKESSIRSNIENTLEKIDALELRLRECQEIREGLLLAYKKYERAKSDSKKDYLKGVISGMEWLAKIRESF